jgi:signal transduction histidine kinase
VSRREQKKHHARRSGRKKAGGPAPAHVPPGSKRPRAGGPPGAAEREHARRHIDRLYEISKLLTSFTNVEDTVPEVFRLVTEAIPLRSAILIEEVDGRPRTTVWHAPDARDEHVTEAEARARASYDHLVPEGRGSSRELDVKRRTSKYFSERHPEPAAGPAERRGFILLPLVTDHLPIAGALQVEPADTLDPIDLAFVNGLANQLAIALDRYNAWKNEVVLRARAEALAAENARLLREAQAAVQARDDFISLASHELRSPITSLDLQVKMLRRAGPAAVAAPEVLDKSYEVIQRQTSKLMLLITKLLDTTRVAIGQLDVDIEPGVDLAEIAREAVERLALDAARARCAIAVDAGEPARGRWDHLRLEQVVTNLLSNAIKYAAGKPIEVRVRRTDAMAKLVVRDHGPGIPPEDLGRIFARFERAGNLRQHPGLGLGLYITREIVQRHGGSIAVASELGKGTTFTVELPIEPPPQPPGRPRPKP